MPFEAAYAYHKGVNFYFVLKYAILLRDTVSAFSCTNSFIAQKGFLVSDVTMSCDCHMVIPNDVASIVVALVPMYGERWLA